MRRVASGRQEAATNGAALAAGAVRRLHNPFLPLIPKAMNGADRKQGLVSLLFEMSSSSMRHEMDLLKL